MKYFIIFLVFICTAAALFAQVPLPEHQFAEGTWSFTGQRLFQNNERSGLAKMNLRAAQEGPMLYEFNVRYENGLEDGHGGFGLHIFMDSAYDGRSWGAGNSYLLWLNYDEDPISSDIPEGLSFQVYRSRTNSIMDLVESFDLNEHLPCIEWEDILNPVPVKIRADGDTGEIRVYDPSDPDLLDYYYFFLDSGDLPLRGGWAALRTNGLSLSFGIGY